MLSNAYFLAKFRFDTAENEPAKKLQNLQNLLIFANIAHIDLLVPHDVAVVALLRALRPLGPQRVELAGPVAGLHVALLLLL